MSAHTISQLFGEKASAVKPDGSLGDAVEAVRFDHVMNRFEQRYACGLIVSKSPAPKSGKDLIVSFGPLCRAASSPGGAWLGAPLEDVYVAVNAENYEIFVQRFEKGVIWCRKDGYSEVNWLSWRDWHAISRPGDKGDGIP